MEATAETGTETIGREVLFPSGLLSREKESMEVLLGTFTGEKLPEGDSNTERDTGS